MIKWRFIGLPTINDRKPLKIRSSFYNIIIQDSLLLNGMSLKHDNIAGHRGMNVCIHKEIEETVSGIFFFLGTIIVMMVVLPRMRHI